MSYLVFIDTNIYLDFYRYRNDVSLSLLQRLDNNHNRIITTAEVEMEYKKNRQKVILEALHSIRPQSAGQLNMPSFLKESKYNKTSSRLAKERDTLANKLLIRTEKLLESPGRYDPVYKILQRLFKARATCHLNRGSKIRADIREKAQKRYILGYPPRKPNDTSVGDAINWEWIIHCARQCQDNIVLISRDSDYGAFEKSNYYLNDWLVQEFKERVSHNRSITLTGRLAEGFRIAGITVPAAEEQAEQNLLKALQEAADRISYSELHELANRITRYWPSIPVPEFPDNIPSSRNLIDDESSQPQQLDNTPDNKSS